MFEFHGESVVLGEVKGKLYMGTIQQLDSDKFLASVFDVGQPGPFLHNDVQVLQSYDLATEFVLSTWNKLNKQ